MALARQNPTNRLHPSASICIPGLASMGGPLAALCGAPWSWDRNLIDINIVDYYYRILRVSGWESARTELEVLKVLDLWALRNIAASMPKDPEAAMRLKNSLRTLTLFMRNSQVKGSERIWMDLNESEWIWMMDVKSVLTWERTPWWKPLTRWNMNFWRPGRVKHQLHWPRKASKVV